jgi:hypothetical protein
MHMTRRKAIGDVTRQEKTEKRAIVGPRITWKVQNCKGNIPARTAHNTAMEQTYPHRFLDFIPGSSDGFQLTPSTTYVYTDVSEERANFIFAVTEMRPRRSLNSATLNIVTATLPKRQDQTRSYTVSKPTRVSSNY